MLKYCYRCRATHEIREGCPQARRWGGRKAQRLRALVLERDGHECAECGATSNLQVDHIIPWAVGGSDDPENLRIMCQSCNRAKSASV